ncbi:MAG: DUF305 domain-containing protein [Gemmatimonadaceae bacterium]|nr:DUF305 domain-containing protein [Gemmatimonadaceae bacterium]
MAISVSFRFLTAALAAAVAASCTTVARSPSHGTPDGARPYGIPGLQHTPADVHFMTGMIHHHAQAVVMASWAPTHGASPELQRLAQRIAVAQNDEIALMQTWLKDKGEPVPEAKPGPMKMVMNGMEHDMLMPGMLSDPQLKGLDEARGLEFDRLFLTFMIQHHEGAVTMVDALFGSPGAGQDEVVFRFASDVYADQTTEIDRMEKMLDARPQPASSKSPR